jgi:hypothetical protein
MSGEEIDQGPANFPTNIRWVPFSRDHRPLRCARIDFELGAQVVERDDFGLDGRRRRAINP